MMPSRGVHVAARGIAPRLFQLQCRKLSSASNRVSHTPLLRNGISSTSRTVSWRTSIPYVSSPLTATRHASTTPTHTPEQAALAPTPPPEPTSFPTLDTINLDDINIANDIPERIGFLQEIGLNYGYGPTSLVEWVLEHIHIYSGLPWWGSIMVTAAALRISLFPLFLKSSDTMARQSALMSLTKPISERMKVAQRNKDNETLMAAYQEMNALRKRAGITYRDQFAPMILQGVFGFGAFKLLRAMSNLPVPGLKTGGFLWLEDLTLYDGYLLFPAGMAVILHLLVRMGGESGAQVPDAMTQGLKRFMMWGMPLLIFLMMSFQPGALCVWFGTTTAIGIGQSFLLQRPAARDFFGLTPLYRPKKEEMDAGPLAALTDKWRLPPKKAAEASQTRPNGKNSAYMSPTYQSPSLRRTTSSSTANKLFKKPNEVIDVNLVDRTESGAPQPTYTPNSRTSDGEDMVQPNAPKPSVVTQAKEGWDRIKSFASQTQKQANSPEERARKKEENYHKAAEAYERRAQRAQKSKKGR